MPVTVLEPGDAVTAAAMLARASLEGMAVMPRGSATKLTWGAGPSRVDAYLSSAHLNSPIEHYAGDLVAKVPAGATLAEVNALLGKERQWLPLDPPYADRATIGGIVATGDSGPRRQRHGAPRDLIVGIELALVDGKVAKAGGRVVKNVAGYDLARLLCGSFGSLAVITSATFKLTPTAQASRTVVARVSLAQTATDLALAIASAPLSPSAIEIAGPPVHLLVRFETTELAAAQQASAAATILERGGAAVETLAGQPELDAWRQHEARVWSAGGTLLKVAVLPTAVADLLLEVERLASVHGLQWSAAGRAALGVVFVRLTGDVAGQAQLIAAIRERVHAGRGSVVVLEGSPDVKAQVDPWGDIGDAIGVMRAVKARFDPRHTLSPGRGPGGI
jgi:glycolate oxidase FAD binding subunit